ncbi:unnamed protein product [Clavelina lepadiformis]|uniref:Protein TAR1 n=1 Tax=Clavelina lepadiformis TaxID=159417 RepID=A0ABP0FBJ4_CLALP
MRPVKVRDSAAISPAAAESARATRQALPVLPLDGFTYFLTLSSKCFSTFPHGTCSLSVSRPYLALDGVYHPLWAAFPNNPTPRRRRARTRIAAMGLTPAMGRSLDQKDAGDPRRAQDEFYTPQFRSAPKATGFGDGLIPLHSPRVVSSDLRPKCKRRHTCRGSTTFAIDRGDLAKRGHLFEVDPPPPRSPIACRTLADFDGTAETQLLRSSRYRFDFERRADDLATRHLKPRGYSTPVKDLCLVERLNGRVLTSTSARGGRFPGDAAATRAGASVRFDNDPSAGSPTETLLRLLLPLNDQVRSSFRTPVRPLPAAPGPIGGPH